MRNRAVHFHCQLHRVPCVSVTENNHGSFERIPALDTPQLMLLFRHYVLKNLLASGKIGQATVDILDRFHHPGFSAYQRESVSPGDSAARESLASRVHAPFSLARLHYERDAAIVTYEPRTPSPWKLQEPSPQQLSPLDALAALTAHIPEKGQQIVRYCGYYSNKARRQRRKKRASTASAAAVVSSLPEPEQDDFRRLEPVRSTRFKHCGTISPSGTSSEACPRSIIPSHSRISIVPRGS